MPKLWRLMLGILLTALFLSAGSTLVVGPDTDAAELPVRADTGPMLLHVEGVPVDDVLPVQLTQHEERLEAPYTEKAVMTVPCVVVSDGNGWPVTGRTWARAVYTACPPEGMPG